MTPDLPPYQFAGARALVTLHDQHLRSCMDTWERARQAAVPMPATKDPDHASIEALGVHVLGCARYYMVWCCEMLELPDPGIDATPTPAAIAADGATYLEHLLDRWRTPLASSNGNVFENNEYRARWGQLFSIDSMLEHAVMHPIRHQFQMEAWMVAPR